MDDKGNFKDFRSAIWFLAFLHYHRVASTFKSVYDLFLRGYYTESTVLLRPIIESFVRLIYVNKNGTIDDVTKILTGFGKAKKEKYQIPISIMFQDISAEIYHLYTILCDFTHGGLLSHIPKIRRDSSNYQDMVLGIEYNIEAAGLITNQYSIYLLCNLEYLNKIYPEMKKRMPEPFAKKYYDTLANLWIIVKKMSEATGSDLLNNATKSLLEY